MQPFPVRSVGTLVLAGALIDGCASALSGVAQPRAGSGLAGASTNRSIANSPLVKLREGEWRSHGTSCSSSGDAEGSPWTDAAVAGGGTLFVTDGTPIEEFYPEAQAQSKPWGALDYSGLNGPEGLFVDKKGTLYVANRNGNDVLEFEKGSSDVIAFTSSYILYPLDVAVNNKSTLYVVNDDGGPIWVFKSGSATPTSLTGFSYPTGLAFDKTWDLYVVDDVYASGSGPLGAVFKLAPHSSKAVNLNLTGLDYPIGVALDSAGDVFVTNLGNDTVTEYAPGATSPKLTISAGICNPVYLTLNKAGDLFVANNGPTGGGGSVSIYEPSVSGGTVVATLTSHAGNARGIGVDAKYGPSPTPKPTKSPRPTPTPA